MGAMGRPGFLDLPLRRAQPRASGLTHVLDKGMPLGAVRDVLASHAALIDLWKLGWGTAYVDPRVEDKVEEASTRGIRACVGGTLLEVAWIQGKADDCLDWAATVGFPCIEVSNGATGMPADVKRRLIARAADRFTVLSEVGSKDPAAAVSGHLWAAEMSDDLAAGASWVLTEGRESGTVGLFRPDGSVREDVVDAVVDAIGVAAVIFEAPRREQQAWLIRRFGPDVNLGNVAADDVAAVEALRLGLRADTLRAPTSLAAERG
jgi:phosphosulfolactate synthase